MPKLCTKCNILLSLEFFSKDSKFRDGKSCVCKGCVKKYNKSNSVHNRIVHQLKIKNLTNEQKLEINRLRRMAYQRNKRKILEINKRYKEKRLKIAPQFRLNTNISTYIRISLKGDKQRRHWENLVGYNLVTLKHHIENQFESWMTWDNYGKKWHIDHIKPVCSFQYTTTNDIEFKNCWALSNLRPLAAELNLKKAQEDKLLSI